MKPKSPPGSSTAVNAAPRIVMIHRSQEKTFCVSRSSFRPMYLPLRMVAPVMKTRLIAPMIVLIGV